MRLFVISKYDCHCFQVAEDEEVAYLQADEHCSMVGCKARELNKVQKYNVILEKILD